MTSVPPVARNGFAFAGSDLYAEVSGHNRHRRATPAELKAHFDSGSDKDHPVHWFEAQLLHYGLPPSKTKSVARMRLFDAVKKSKAGGALKVPAHITKLEGELKKEWTKLDREAKKTLKASGTGGGAAAAGTDAPALKKTGTKRKAEESVDVTVNVAGINITVSKNGTATTSAAQSSVKKAKATAPKAKAAPKVTTPKTAKEKATPAKGKAVAAGKGKSTAAPSKPAKENATSAKGKAAATNKEPTQARQPRTKQTARKSSYRPISVLSHNHHNDPMDEDDEPPPPYTEYSDAGHPSTNSDSSIDSDSSSNSDSSTSSGRPVSLTSLGLLNGRYDIASPEVSEQWPFYGEDFELVLTLAGSSLWGHFELGVVEGVFFLDQRPFESSHDKLYFTWRGREQEGPIMYGNTHQGWIRFLGGGRIEGCLDWQDIDFHGRRLPGQSTTSEISARNMEREWNGYSQEVYEREEQDRWR